MLNAIIRASLNHRVWVLSFAIFMSIFGLMVIPKIPVDVFPDLNRPTVTLMTEANGLAPEEVETFITQPLELALTGIPGVQRVRSTSGVGLSVIYLEFDWNSDIYRNRQFVSEKLIAAKEHLPSNISPIMTPITSIMGEIQLIGLTGDGKNPMEVRSFADWVLRPRLMGVPGIAQVIVMGGAVRQYQIQLSAEKIQKFRLNLDLIEESLKGLSDNTTGGFLESKNQEYLIRNIGSIRSLEDIENTVVGNHFGKPVLVKEIAKVVEGYQVKRGDASVGSVPSVILSIQKQPGASTIELSKKLEEEYKRMETNLPKEIKLHRNLFNQAHFIEVAIQNVIEALRDGTFLVAIILFVFLANFRTTFITLTAIPLSFLLTALIFYWFGLDCGRRTGQPHLKVKNRLTCKIKGFFGVCYNTIHSP